jgi:tuberculosinol/isotuberculosinol synthase
MSMDLETFRSLPTADVAQLVRDGGTKVCVFPINGTRRWFMMEHLLEQEEDFASAYLDVSGRGHIELYQLLFDHGLDTLLTPVFGPDLLRRGVDYMRVVVEGLSRLATHPDFLNFYEAYGVRVRFYGDYRKFFGSTAYASCLVDLFDEVTARTAMHDRHRLFFGVCAQDATETVAEQVVRYYAEHGHVPDKRTLIELYYGEYVEPVDLFIGFDKPSVFDMHLVATGNEDLYFTVSPSLYLNKRQLRDILYDHLYTRREQAPDYSAIGANDWAFIREFYQANRERTLGVGARQKNGGFWYPLPQVELPPGFVEPRN